MNAKFVKNFSDKKQAIAGIAEFQPGEVREVSEHNRKRLMMNPNFEEVKTPKKKTEEPAQS